MEFHNRCLENMCRVCGNRAQTSSQVKRKVYASLCKNSKEGILLVYGVNVLCDDENYPEKICNSCYQKMKKSLRNVDESEHTNNVNLVKDKNINMCKFISSKLWKPHSDSNCEVCLVYQQQTAQGRCPTVQSKGRPKATETQGNIFASLCAIDSASHNATAAEFEVFNVSTNNLNSYICELCTQIYSLSSVKTPCDHYFCSACMSDYFRHKGFMVVQCPTCNTSINKTNIRPADDRFQQQVQNLDVKCKTCQHLGPRATFMLHSCTLAIEENQLQHEVENNIQSTPKAQCEIEIQTSPSLLKITPIAHNSENKLLNLLKRPITSPMSKVEERVYTHMTRKKLKFSSDNMSILCHTGGQPLNLQRVTKPRKVGNNIQSPLKRKRARLLSRFRRTLAGTNVDAQHQQQSSELKLLSKSSRLKICSQAGVKHKTYLSKKVALAMKTTLGLSWSQHRKQKRFLNKMGVAYESENSERLHRNILLSDHLTTKTVTLMEKNDKDYNSVSGFRQITAPIVYVQDLSKFIKELLDGYDRNQQLVWPDNIPQNEIWIKMGGDHGGKSFKLCLQVLNTKAPNSKQNTIAFACMAAKDLYPNLEVVASLFQQQILKLKDEYWNNKKLKLTLFGDYAFLTSLYGLSGARGKHFCLWCLILYSDMQVPRAMRGYSTRRQLSGMKADCDKFQKEGKGKLPVASNYNNSIHAPMWDIKTSNVCPPYLHMLLGIILKHHKLLLSELNELDIAIAEDIAKSKQKLGKGIYDTYISDIRTRREQRNDLGYMEHELSDATSNLTNKEEKELKEQISKLKATLSKNKPSLAVYSGPIVASVQTALKRHNIVQQAYHSNSFVGNHCSKYIKLQVQDDINAAIQENVCALSGSDKINKQATITANKFHKLNKLYADVHSMVGHMKPIEKEDTIEIQRSIDIYLAYFRQLFPNTLIPKQHILEDHSVQWIKRWGFGLAMHGEQAGEALHREFNRIERHMFHVPNESKKLLFTMREHHTITHPDIQQETVTPVRRKKRKI